MYIMKVYVMTWKEHWQGVFSSPQAAAEVARKDGLFIENRGALQLVDVDVDDSIYGNRTIVQDWYPGYVHQTSY